MWYQADPSLGHTIDIGKVRNACMSARDNPAEENIFRPGTMRRKEKSTEKIDGAAAAIMALDRAVRHGGSTGNVYDERGILSF